MSRFKHFRNNSRRKSKSGSRLCASLILCVLVAALPKPTSASTYSISKSAEVSAFIGLGEFTLYGYTSPFARVLIEGPGLFDETTADAEGRFEFFNTYAPLASRETCITAIDTSGRVTTPFCLPPFPITKHVQLGPVLLPPTLSINQPYYNIDDHGVLTGRAAPESNVTLLIAKDTNVRSTELSIQTDEDGNYSLTLPTSHNEDVNIFARNFYRNLESEKSNTLLVSILSLWELVLRWIADMVKYLVALMSPLMYLAEAGIIIFLVYKFLHRRKKYPLTLRPDHTLLDADTK